MSTTQTELQIAGETLPADTRRAGAELAETGPAAGAERLLQIALERGDVDAVERMAALYERERADRRRQAFFESMAGFQTEAPQVVKRKEVSTRGGGLLYKYAPLDAILAVIQPVALRYGFTHRFETVSANEPAAGVNVACVVTHREGHSERTIIHVPPTTGQNTNAAQNAGIALAYGQRYAYVAAYGLALAGEDTDGRTDGDTITDDQVGELESLIERSGVSRDAVLKRLQVGRFEDVRADVWPKVRAGLAGRVHGGGK